MTKSLCMVVVMVGCASEPPAYVPISDCSVIDDDAVPDPGAAVVSETEWASLLDAATPTTSPTSRDDTLRGDIRRWMTSDPSSRLNQVAVAAGDDEALLRAGLQRFDACSKQHPSTLSLFTTTVFDILSQSGEELLSSPKSARRRIVRDADRGVFAAMTLGDDNNIREVEVLLTDRRDEGEIEFIAYDAAGRLRTSSPFPDGAGGQVSLPVPYSCMGCHRSSGRGFVEVHPAPTGIPAQL